MNQKENRLFAATDVKRSRKYGTSEVRCRLLLSIAKEAKNVRRREISIRKAEGIENIIGMTVCTYGIARTSHTFYYTMHIPK